MIKFLLRDSILSGILFGFISISLDYILLCNFDRWYQSVTGNYSLFPAPRIQLIILAVNILLFRFLLVRWNRSETARGLLLVIVVAMAGYMLNRKYHFAP